MCFQTFSGGDIPGPPLRTSQARPVAGREKQAPRCWDPNLGCSPKLYSRGCAPGLTVGFHRTTHIQHVYRALYMPPATTFMSDSTVTSRYSFETVKRIGMFFGTAATLARCTLHCVIRWFRYVSPEIRAVSCQILTKTLSIFIVFFSSHCLQWRLP